MILANELLDNLPFRVVQRTVSGWQEVRVNVCSGYDWGYKFSLVTVPAEKDLMHKLRLMNITSMSDIPVGACVPVQIEALQWVANAHKLLRSDRRSDRSLSRSSGRNLCRIVAFDYGADTPNLAQRTHANHTDINHLSQDTNNTDTNNLSSFGWLRSFRSHRHSPWLTNPGSCDITTDVAFDQIQTDYQADVCSQADFLVRHGINELVDEGKAVWRERAHICDLLALQCRSRVREAESLTDAQGLGAFSVITWRI